MSSLSTVRFECTSLAGTGKKGILQPDKDGYYEMVVGGLNVFNSAGQFYVYEEARNLFEKASVLMRRISRGALKGEWGHPKRAPGMTYEQYVTRILSIYEEYICCHHKEIWLDFDRIKDANGKPAIAIMSKVCPSGPLANVLERSIKNPCENTCFSIRSFTDDFMDGSIYKRVLKQVVTFDAVNEPGIPFAEKYKAPGLESLVDEQISRGSIERAVKHAKHTPGMAQESTLLSAGELFKAMGWEIDAKDPSWTKW